MKNRKFKTALGSFCSVIAAALISSGCVIELNNPVNTGTGKYIYTSNYSTVDHLQIKEDGTPEVVNTYQTTASGNRGIVVSHNQKFLYVNGSHGYIDMFYINPKDGSLRFLLTHNVGYDSYDMKIHPNPSNHWIYVTDRATGNEAVRVYDYDLETGVLTEKFSRTALTGQGNTGLISFSDDSETDPKFMFLGHMATNSISALEINNTDSANKGELTYLESVISNLNPLGSVFYTDDSNNSHIYQVGTDASDILGGTTDPLTILSFLDDGSTYLTPWDWTDVTEYVVIESEPYIPVHDKANNRILVPHLFSDNISVLNINTTTGALTEDAMSPVTVPDGNPASAIRGPTVGKILDGRFYLLEFGSETMTVLNLSDLTPYNGGTTIKLSSDPYYMTDIVEISE